MFYGHNVFALTLSLPTPASAIQAEHQVQEWTRFWLRKVHGVQGMSVIVDSTSTRVDQNMSLAALCTSVPKTIMVKALEQRYKGKRYTQADQITILYGSASAIKEVQPAVRRWEGDRREYRRHLLLF